MNARVAAACFAITLLASFAGFGALGASIAIAKALAVASLLLFFVMLYRVLCAVEMRRSADS
jgi:hypothetical protein